MSATASVITSPYFSFLGTDLTAHTVGNEINRAIEELEFTASGDVSRLYEIGLGTWVATVTLRNNPTVEAALYAADRTSGTIILKKANATVAASNPSYTWTGWAKSYPLLTGGVGELQTIDVELAFKSDLVRSTTP